MEQNLLVYGLIIVILLNLALVTLIAKFIIDNKKPAVVETGNIEKNKRITSSNFEKDIQYLMFLVDYFCKNARETRLIPYQRANNSFSMINDEVFNEVVLETTRKVVNFVSEDYRELLKVYMDNATDFTSTLVFNKITEYTMEINKETIKKVNSLRQ
jgi:hypothetical protein